MEMSIFLEKALAKKESVQYRRYKVIRKLMIFCDEENGIGIDDRYYTQILMSYLDENTKILNEESLVYSIYEFFEKAVDLYLLNKTAKYNFLVDESDLKPFLKKWLKDRKEDIKKFMDFYLGNSFVGFVNSLFKNKYFEIFQIRGKQSEKAWENSWVSAYPDSENIVIRIVLKGKIYYNDGLLLEENCYIVTDKRSLLDKCLLLSKEVDVVFIVIKKYFIKEFNLIEPNTKIKVKSNIRKDDLNKIINFRYLKQHPFFFFEILINFFKVNSVIEDSEFLFSKTIIEEKYLNEIQNIIMRNITLETEEIEKCIEKELELSEDIINNYLVKNLDTTLKKWIIRLKLKVLVEESYFQDRSVEDLRKELAITNVKNLRYNLKAYYDMSVKDMKR